MEDRSNKTLGLILVASALITAAFIGAALGLPPQTTAGRVFHPAIVLVDSFSVLAWWVPLYFGALAAFAFSRRRMGWSAVVLLNALHIPVITMALILRIAVDQSNAGGPLPAFLVVGFTERGAILVLSLLLAVQAIAYLQLSRRLISAPDDSTGSMLRLPAPSPMPDERVDSIYREDSTHREDPAHREDSAHGEDSTHREDPDDRAIDAWELQPADPAFSGTNPREAQEEPTDINIALADLRRRMSQDPEDWDVEEEAEEEEEAEAPTAQRWERKHREDDEIPNGDGQTGAGKTGTELARELSRELARESGAPPEPPLPLLLRGRRRDTPGTIDTVEHEISPESGEDCVGTTVDAGGGQTGDRTGEIAEAGDEQGGHAFVDDRGFARDYDRDPKREFEQDSDRDPNREFEQDSDRGIARAFEKESNRKQSRYAVPVQGILDQYGDGRYWEIDESTRDAAEVLRVTLEEFGIRAEVTGIRKGPVITMFEILPAPGVKLTKITNLSDNIALRLAASSVRIVAPIPGKHAVGIEIPNRRRHLVSFAELLLDEEFFGDTTQIPIALGKDISGEAQIVDLTKMPHVLIAGATGSGKSVCVNSIICSVLYRRPPSEVKMILIDPKIVELKFYNDIPHLLTPVITDPKRAFQALQYLIYEMERRYSLLDTMGARDIAGYNARIKRRNLATEPLPYIVVVIDEFADLMTTSGKELESTVARLAAMSRAVGIHLILATQRPSTDVITGLIKANIPSRIAFMVASKVDSRIIIDSMGAEKLLGRGDMLFTSASDPFPVRMQGAFLSEDEVERVAETVKEFGEPEYIDDEIFLDDDEEDAGGDFLEDPLLERAIEVVNTSKKASASYLQRRLKVGYNRAARMVEEMERMGIVGPQNGSKPREIISS